MLAALDVDYRDNRAQCACICFADWHSTKALETHCVGLENVAPYQAGAFFKRELPGLLQALAEVKVPLEAILIDAYVWLAPGHGGLGWHLYEALADKVPVIGVAKTRFRQAEEVAIPVLRRNSQNPLWITAIGMDLEEAAMKVSSMHGSFRIPTMLKLADTRCRTWDEPAT
jgi:deoxyribonuclease V